MDTKLLRQKILDLAIHGKLVPQNPADEPASVLLERIKAEKERLIKAGKIKKSTKTSDAPHYENMPFEVPSSWVWTTLGKCTINRDSERIPVSSSIRKKQTNKIYDYYGASGVIDKVEKYLFNERLLLIGEDGANLLSRSKKNAFFADGKYWVNNHAHILDSNPKQILDYIALVINSKRLDDYITGSAQPKLSQDNLHKILIPLPPLSEQKKIIHEVESLNCLIDSLESSKNDLQSTIKQTKSKILDLAIHGKLVSQNPKDEPTIELLKRINPKAEINCDNALYPFEVPNNWLLMQGKSIFAPMRSTKPTANSFLYVDIDSIDNRLNTSHPKLVETYLAPSRASRYTEKGDVLFSMVRPYLRNIAMIESNNCIASTGFYVCHSNGSILPKYCLNLMLSDYVVNGLNQFMKGDNSPSINKSHIDSFIFPIPPLPEQQRIVTKIEELFAVIDNIQKLLEA